MKVTQTSLAIALMIGSMLISGDAFAAESATSVEVTGTDIVQGEDSRVKLTLFPALRSYQEAPLDYDLGKHDTCLIAHKEWKLHSVGNCELAIDPESRNFELRFRGLSVKTDLYCSVVCGDPIR